MALRTRLNKNLVLLPRAHPYYRAVDVGRGPCVEGKWGHYHGRHVGNDIFASHQLTGVKAARRIAGVLFRGYCASEGCAGACGRSNTAQRGARPLPAARIRKYDLPVQRFEEQEKK
jgi:hypothetical protein